MSNGKNLTRKATLALPCVMWLIGIHIGQITNVVKLSSLSVDSYILLISLWHAFHYIFRMCYLIFQYHLQLISSGNCWAGNWIWNSSCKSKCPALTQYQLLIVHVRFGIDISEGAHGDMDTLQLKKELLKKLENLPMGWSGWNLHLGLSFHEYLWRLSLPIY